MLQGGGHVDELRRGLLELTSLQQDDGGWPAHALMRIPPPHVAEPDGLEAWRADGLGTGVLVRDHHRLFTTAACISMLALSVGSAS